MSEARLRKYILSNFPSANIQWTQIESHATSIGVPDMAYCIGGFNNWIEFKYGNLKKPPTIRPAQVAWFRRNCELSGNPLILAAIEFQKGMVYCLYHGSKATQLKDVSGRDHLHQWLDIADVKWSNKIEWETLQTHMTHPGGVVGLR
jgi:hypothetical protein